MQPNGIIIVAKKATFHYLFFLSSCVSFSSPLSDRIKENENRKFFNWKVSGLIIKSFVYIPSWPSLSEYEIPTSYLLNILRFFSFANFSVVFEVFLFLFILCGKFVLIQNLQEFSLSCRPSTKCDHKTPHSRAPIRVKSTF